MSLNITRGGGYTPRAASESLARNYGDCKDKATLMRALLKAVGIDAYLTTISADDRTYVRPEWASPFQFNHAIIAVKVSEAVKLPTVIPDSPLGRLLMFDPTDPVTPVGGLPTDEQGSYALVIAGPTARCSKCRSCPPPTIALSPPPKPSWTRTAASLPASSASISDVPASPYAP